ncbi:hypothetical protein BCV69DRAFT_389 [Microstroma glucosiphilum]|uniref:Uncharacterized protein n=1 Tax=Pseudomicrostroma glucosiphilum TaxID=1684307 RepID=A0A316UHR9_9BASI|nr:hypothetical protein BCV69DRAFT_389 [Pseudomicrostroma glucosiphilum]PWN23473.1 hypothetical protein BCV69DRAFT_389 [Pseudomicrostroma glucosiphilum]
MGTMRFGLISPSFGLGINKPSMHMHGLHYGSWPTPKLLCSLAGTSLLGRCAARGAYPIVSGRTQRPASDNARSHSPSPPIRVGCSTRVSPTWCGVWYRACGNLALALGQTQKADAGPIVLRPPLPTATLCRGRATDRGRGRRGLSRLPMCFGVPASRSKGGQHQAKALVLSKVSIQLSSVTSPKCSHRNWQAASDGLYPGLPAPPLL